MLLHLSYQFRHCYITYISLHSYILQSPEQQIYTFFTITSIHLNIYKLNLDLPFIYIHTFRYTSDLHKTAQRDTGGSMINHSMSVLPDTPPAEDARLPGMPDFQVCQTFTSRPGCCQKFQDGAERNHHSQVQLSLQFYQPLTYIARSSGNRDQQLRNL